MEQNSKREELREYLRRTTGSMLKVVWPFLLLSAMFSWMSIGNIFDGDLSAFTVITAIIVFPIFLLLLRVVLFSKRSYRKKMDEFESRADYGEILRDFERSKSFADDEIRLGTKYIFGSESERVITYDSIASIFQYVHSTNFVEDSRELRANMTNGQSVTICKLPLRKEGEQAFLEIALIMRCLNPDIRISKYAK